MRWMIVSLLVLGACAPVLGQEVPSSSAGTNRPEEREDAFANEVAAIIASTWERREGASLMTVGAEYERRLTSRIGLVGELEYLFDSGHWVAAAPVVVHVRSLKLFAGPGFERTEREDADDEEADTIEDAGDRETRFLLRTGAAYALEFGGRYSAGPTVSLDFVREPGEWTRAVVYGLTFGVAF